MVNPRFVIKAVLSGQRLNINVPLTVAGTVNYIGVEAKCTSEWDDCTVVCYLYQAGTGYTAQLGLIYDAERKLYYFPNAERLTLTAGEWAVWFVGVMAESGQETYRVTSDTRYFSVYPNPFASSIPPGDISLDEEAIARATDAQNKANLLLDKYNAGELTGPQGEPGDPAHIGFVQASVDNTTTDPRCAVTVTESPDNTYNMQFAFAGIKGAKGDTGATGPKGDTGAQGAPGRDGTDGRDGVDGETIDDYVLVQAEQPTSETNKMWLKPTAGGDPIMIPSAEEFESALGEETLLLDSPMIYSPGIYNTTGGTGISATRIRSKIFRIPGFSEATLKAATGYEISTRLARLPLIYASRFTFYHADTTWFTERTFKNNAKEPIYLCFNYRTENSAGILPSHINSNNAPTLTIKYKNLPVRESNHTKILFIGNSKSVNSAELLTLIASQNGFTDFEVVVPYKGAISLQDHYDNRNNTSFYDQTEYYLNYVNAYRSITGKSLTDIIAENPDITHVIFQQQTQYANTLSSYSVIKDLSNLFNNCDRFPKMYIMSVWVDDDSTFTNTDVLNTIKSFVENSENYIAYISGIIPTGLAIEKLQHNTVFTNTKQILSDGKHLNSGFPRIMAALMVLAGIYGVPQNCYIHTYYTADNSLPLQEQLCYQIARETTAYTFNAP